MKNLTLEELFEIASQPKAKTRKADARRVQASVTLINRAYAKGYRGTSILEAVTILND